MSSVASSAITGTSSRSRRSCVDGDADADGRRTGANERGESLALGHGERLRVTNARNAMAAGPHDDGRGDDGATRRGDTDLVDTDDTGQAIAPQMALEAERRDDDRH